MKCTAQNLQRSECMFKNGIELTKNKNGQACLPSNLKCI